MILIIATGALVANSIGLGIHIGKESSDLFLPLLGMALSVCAMFHNYIVEKIDD